MKKILTSLIICILFSTGITVSAGPAASVHWFTYSERDTGVGNTQYIQNILNGAGYSSSYHHNWSNTSVRDDIGGKAIFHIWTHGNPGIIQCQNGNVSAVAIRQKYLSSGLDNSRLIYFEGCKTAVSDFSNGDLNNYTYTLGADCTLGYLQTIYFYANRGCYEYSRMLYEHAFSEHISVSSAILAARNELYNLRGEFYATDSIERCGDTFLTPPAYGS